MDENTTEEMSRSDWDEPFPELSGSGAAEDTGGENQPGDTDGGAAESGESDTDGIGQDRDPEPGGENAATGGNDGDEAGGEDDDWDSAADEPEDAKDGELFTLKYMGEEKQLGRQDVITLAQKGMDYDRIRARLDAAVSAGGAPQNRRDREIGELISAVGPLDPEKIPAGVWSEVERGVPLLTAITRRENAELKKQLEAERQSRLNSSRSTGSLDTAGTTRAMSAFERDWYAAD